VSTDGGQSFPIMTSQTQYADTAAPAGVVTPGVVAASDGTFDTHIAVSLSGASAANGAVASYAVRAVTLGGTVTSNTATGYRSVGPLTYQWYRHDFGEAYGSTRSLISNATTTSFVDTTTAGARLHGYDCTISAAGAPSVTTKPDAGWRAARAAETPRTDTWVTNGGVNAVAVATDLIYIGGNFDYVGPPTGAFAALDATTGAASLRPARVQVPYDNGNEVGVATSIQDGAGRWYIGGDFSAVSGVPQARVARVTASGQLDPTFAPLVLDGNVRSIAVSADTVFIAGTFTSVDWQPRNGFAALDIATGALKPLSPTVTAPPSVPAFIGTLHVSGNVLFVGGSFTNIDGIARNGIAAIDIPSGSITSWDAQASGPVGIAAVSGDTMYVVGSFNQIGGQQRDRVAALDVTTGAATAFNPDPDDSGYIHALATNGTTVFVAGSFITIGGQNRRGFAALDANTGAALPVQLQPVGSPIGGVISLAISGNTLYVGGDFESIANQPRKRLAAVNATTGEVLSWAPVAPRRVWKLNVVNNTVYVGGQFTSIGGKSQRYLAALDRNTGAPTSWNPDPDGFVFALALSGSSLFVGGWFANIGGQARNWLASLDRTTGAATTWAADANQAVSDLAVNGTTLYVAGGFTSIAGQPRSSLASLDVNTANVTAWAPNPNGGAGRLAINGGTVYVAGGFTSIGGQSRNALAAVDATSGQVASWAPNPNDTVSAFCVAASTLYVGGAFTMIGGQSRSVLASFDLSSNALLSWSSALSGSSPGVFALAVAGNTLYASGYFSVDGRPPNYAGAVDVTTGNAVAWYPWWLGAAMRFAVDGTSLIAVGGLQHVAGYPRGGIAIFDL